MPTLSIGWKEFRGFVNSPVAYIFVIAFCSVLSGFFFIWGSQRGTFFSQGTTELGSFFYYIPLAMGVLIPALAMKLWPDELKSGTVELLMSYPLRSWQVVFGKFVAGLLLIVVALACTLMTPFTIAGYGAMDWGPVWGAYFASLLVGAAFLSVGLFMGALCREQVTAFILTLAVCLAFVAMGTVESNLFIPEAWHKVTGALSFTTRFNDLGRGVIDLSDTVYFLSFTGLFLVLNIVVLECRKGK